MRRPRFGSLWLVLVGCSLERPGISGVGGAPPAPQLDGGDVVPPETFGDSGVGSTDTGSSCMPHCEGDVRVDCEGGMAVRVPCDDACLEGSPPTCGSFAPSNVPVELLDAIDASAAVLTVSSPSEWDTGRCDTLPGGTLVAQGAAEVALCVVRVASLTIQSTLTVRGPHALVLLSTGRVEIVAGGALVGSASDDSPGPGEDPPARASLAGGGVTSGRAGGLAADSSGGGGGGGACGGGGSGGSPIGATPIGGLGGAAYDSSLLLSPLRAGSGGGGGGDPGVGGLGGGGGGAIQISARQAIVIAGRIDLNGGGGGGGMQDAAAGSGGGGGGGGSLLLESPIAVTITGEVYVSGGGGGGGAGCIASCDGGAGENGAVPIGGLYGTACNMSCADRTLRGRNMGGQGGTGGTETAGGEGGSGQASPGGGGGGAGCVVVRTLAPTIPTVGTGIWRVVGPRTR